jgi:peptide/nickel transport system substrate-binding protein
MKLLEGAGYAKGSDGMYAKGGQPLKLRLATTDAPLRKNVSQVIQANLKQIGVELELEFLPGSAFFGKQGPLTQGNFQLGMYTWLAAPDPDVSSLYNSRSIPTAENSYTGQNYPRYASTKVDDLLTQGASELSADKRKGIYCDAVKTWTDDVPVMPLFQRLVTTTARANMGNYRPTPTSTPETWNMWAWFVPGT